MTRPAAALADVVRREAAAAGMYVSDYIASVLAVAHDMPECIPTRPRSDGQGQFDIDLKDGERPAA